MPSPKEKFFWKRNIAVDDYCKEHTRKSYNENSKQNVFGANVGQINVCKFSDDSHD